MELYLVTPDEIKVTSVNRGITVSRRIIIRKDHEKIQTRSSILTSNNNLQYIQKRNQIYENRL